MLKTIGYALTCFFLSSLFCLDACTQQQAKTVETDVLSLTQIACVMSSALTDSQAVADACAIDKALVPVIQQLISEREAAKKSGVVWQADAGK